MNRPAAGFLLAVATLALGSCTPWTVRPIDSASESLAAGGALNPAAYVDSIWSSKLIPAILASAVDARTLLDAVAASPSAAREKFGRREAGGPVYFIVKGEGRLRGTALRDATGIVRFTDFINQLQFADVANEMNGRVLQTVLAGLTPSALENRIVSFAGAATLDDAAQPPIRDLIPVRLTVEAAQ